MVLFTSNRPLGRAENISAVYEAYDGEKAFVQVDPYRRNLEVSSRKYSVRVTDEFISASPGKAILLGHGLEGAKLYGLDQPNPYYHRRFAGLLTYVITTSPAMIPMKARQCGVPEDRVLPLGMPRTDRYFGAKKGNGGTFLAGKKRAYLYAPTYRTREETPLPDIDWERIDKALTNDEALVVKAHMLQDPILRGRQYQNIAEVSKDLPTGPFLIDCDVLITDYSSLMLDAHILEKPVVLFEKQKGYTETRGMYLKYPDEYSSRYARTEDELIELLRTARGQTETERRCRERTAGACDGHSTERVVELIRKEDRA